LREFDRPANIKRFQDKWTRLSTSKTRPDKDLEPGFGSTKTEKALERRNRIMDAGLKLCLSHGMRGTTMEALAKEAGIAKPTLYSYFPDKMAVYAAIAQRLFEDLKELVLQGFSGPGCISVRVAKALTDKHCLIFSLLEGSPHADEIYGDKGRFAAEEVEHFERWLERELVALLKEDGHKEPLRYARLVIACAEGIARRAKSRDHIGADTKLMCEKLLS